MMLRSSLLVILLTLCGCHRANHANLPPLPSYAQGTTTAATNPATGNQISDQAFEQRQATADDLRRVGVAKLLEAGDVEWMRPYVKDLPNLEIGMKAINLEDGDYRELGEILRSYVVRITQLPKMRGSECQGFKFLDINTCHGL